MTLYIWTHKTATHWKYYSLYLLFRRTKIKIVDFGTGNCTKTTAHKLWTPMTVIHIIMTNAQARLILFVRMFTSLMMEMMTLMAGDNRLGRRPPSHGLVYQAYCSLFLQSSGHDVLPFSYQCCCVDSGCEVLSLVPLPRPCDSWDKRTQFVPISDVRHSPSACWAWLLGE